MASGLFGTGAEAPRLDPIAIQPAGIPGSIFVRPQQQQRGGNLAGLARGLSSLSPALQQFAETTRVLNEDPQSRENRDFIDSIAGKSPEELQRMVRDGDAKTRVQKDGLASLLGSRAADEFRRETLEWYGTEFDRNEGDLKAELDARRQRYAAGLPDDAARAGFFRGTDQWSEQLLQGNVKERVEVAVSERNSAVVAELRMMADDALGAGASADDAAAQVLRQSGLNRDFRGLAGPEQNATLFALAQEYAAQGRPDIVRALLDHDRGGVGPLSKVAAFAVKSTDLVRTAQARADEAAEAGSYEFHADRTSRIARGEWTEADSARAMAERPHLNPATAAGWTEQSRRVREEAAQRQAREDDQRELQETAREAQAEALASAGAAMDQVLGAQTLKDVVLPTENGGTRVYSAADQTKDVVQTRLRQFDAAERSLRERGVPAAEARQRILRQKLNWFDGNGVANPEWEAIFTSAAVVASIPRLADGGPRAERLAEVAEEFYQIHGINPAYAARLVGDARAREFLEVYADQRSSLDPTGAADPATALAEAARISNRTPAERAAYSATAEEADALVRDAFSRGPFRLAPQNLAMASDLLREYLGREMPRAAALEKVRQTLAEQSVEVNGVRVFGPGRTFPRDFAPALEGHLQTFAQTNGAAFGIESGADLFIADTGDRTGTYAIMRKDGGYPVGRLTQAEVDEAVRDYADAGTRRAAAWGRSVEENGRVVAFLKWMGNGFEVDGGNLTTAEAEAFLADREERARIDAWLSRQARNDGVNRDAFSGKWFRTGRFGGTQEVRPEVTWSDTEKGVVWRAAE